MTIHRGKNAIKNAVEPLRADAIERARQEGEAEIERTREALAEAGGDINKAAPYPRSRLSLSSMDFYIGRARYNRFHAITSDDPAYGYQSSNGSRPYFVVIDEAKAARYVQKRMEDAAAEYDSFVAKLILKIGEAKDATLIGNHVWGHSTLVVTKAGGVKEAWLTQQIVNYSKLGKPFNQWPTRKMKAVPELKAAA